MPLSAVVGLQFGDEGKGKFVDFLAERATHVARFNGGANAGHTVQLGNIRGAFSQLPASLERKRSYICAGALISPDILLKEIAFMTEVGLPPLVTVDFRCHVVLPLHEQINAASETFKGKRKIGSVGKGIGACVEDRANRHGVRLYDLLNRDQLREKISLLWSIRERQIRHVFDGELTGTMDDLVDKLCDWGSRLAPYMGFTDELLRQALLNNEDVLLETSQATFLDNTYGTYPYTVAYQTLVQNSLPLIGLPAQAINTVGVMKGYSIRVGNGPFPTELHDETADILRIKGREFGTVSGRPRRCGWLDLSLIKQAVKLNGVKEIALTNVDVLSGFASVKAAVGYELKGRRIEANEALLQMADVTPVYQDFVGWPTLPEKITKLFDLPAALTDFVHFIEKFVGCRVSFISYGPDRAQTLSVVV